MQQPGTPDSAAGLRPLRELAGGPPRRGLPLRRTAALLLDRAARNQLAIYDPSCVGLLRRVATAADLAPWVIAEPARYLLALPSGWTAATFGDLPDAAAREQLAARLPPIAARLEGQGGGDRWWELGPYDLTLFAGARLAWPVRAPEPRFALTAPGTLVTGDCGHLPGSPFLLGVLMSQAGRRQLERLAGGWPGRLGPALLGRLPVPAAAPEGREVVGALAEQIAEQERARRQLERDVTAALLRSFGPPGSTPGPRLEAWWELRFDELRGEIDRRLGGDIPARYREEWAARHARAVAERDVAVRDVGALIARLDGLVAELYAG